MTTPFSSDDTFFLLNSADRYDKLVKTIRQGLSLWTLADSEGCLIIALGQDKVLPIWPSQQHAESWGKSEYEGFSGLEITAENWQEKWLSGMSNDGFMVGAAPNLAGECIVSSAQEHALDISTK
ncbi:DUF2750 domain-containing protein [Marinomonas sp.]